MTDEITKLTIIHINDVYELENFSRISTCKQQETSQSNKTIVVLAGDFIYPSLLSSIDKGQGIVECMNVSGVDYVCLGNHESDVQIDYLHQRIRQSKFEWINSNIPDFALPSDISKLLEYKIIEVTNKMNNNIRKIAMLGLCCNDPSIMSTGSFGKFTIEDVNNKVKLLHEYLINIEKVDLVIPLTHQEIIYDRQLAEMNIGLSLILGGHEHTVFQETINDCQILKTGINASKIGIVTIIWNDEDDIKPNISIDLKDASSYPPDVEVEKVINKYKQVLDNLKTSNLYKIPNGMIFSTKLVRFKQKNVGTFLTTILKQALKLECMLLHAGTLRGDYDLIGEYFTFADFIKILPFNDQVAIIDLPGKVIQEIITYTRRFAYQEQQLENPSFIQTDDGITFESHSNNIITINHEQIDHNRVYKCGIVLKVINGLNAVIPLLDYAKTLPMNIMESFKKDDNYPDLKHVIISYFAKHILCEKILLLGGFDNIDDNHDNLLSKDEILNNIAKQLINNIQELDFYKLLVNMFFECLDVDKDDYISKNEINDYLNQPDLIIKY